MQAAAHRPECQQLADQRAEHDERSGELRRQHPRPEGHRHQAEGEAGQALDEAGNKSADQDVGRDRGHQLCCRKRYEEKPMIAAFDIKSELGKLTMLKDRTPTSTDAEREKAFGRPAPYRDGAIFTAKFAGRSAWERHPQGDEIVQIIDGATTLHVITAEGRQSLALAAGMLAV